MVCKFIKLFGYVSSFLGLIVPGVLDYYFYYFTKFNIFSSMLTIS